MPRPGAICLLFQLLEVLSYSKAVQWFRVQLHRRCLVSDLTPPHRVLVFWMIVQIILKVLHSFISYLLTPFKPGCTLRSLGRAPLSDPPSSLKTKETPFSRRSVWNNLSSRGQRAGAHVTLQLCKASYERDFLVLSALLVGCISVN